LICNTLLANYQFFVLLKKLEFIQMKFTFLKNQHFRRYRMSKTPFRSGKLMKNNVVDNILFKINKSIERVNARQQFLWVIFQGGGSAKTLQSDWIFVIIHLKSKAAFLIIFPQIFSMYHKFEEFSVWQDEAGSALF
jgi:hypothetical protein